MMSTPRCRGLGIGARRGHARPTSSAIGKLDTTDSSKTTSTIPIQSNCRRHSSSTISCKKFVLEKKQGMRDYDSYFRCKRNVTIKIGFTSYKIYSGAIRMLVYGVAYDLIDEDLRMSETTCLDSMYMFCKRVIRVFIKVHLREPNVDNTARLMSINEARGFLGMSGSIDCMNWEWNNFPFVHGRDNIAGLVRDAL
jgi:hypothetical protein